MTNYQKVTHVFTMLLSISFTNFVHTFKYKVIRKTLNDNIREQIWQIFVEGIIFVFVPRKSFNPVAGLPTVKDIGIAMKVRSMYHCTLVKISD